MTGVLQASQSHWGLLLRNEAVSPFSISMSNSATSLFIEQHFVTYHFSHQQLEKNFFRHFQSVTFSCYLEVILVLAGGGDRVGANERRQTIWHTFCRCRHITIAYLAAKYKTSHTAIRRNVDVLSASYPIVTLRGHGGGIKLADWYEPGKIQLTPAQMNLLLRISKTLTGSDSHIMRSIISQFSDPKKKR